MTDVTAKVRCTSKTISSYGSAGAASFKFNVNYSDGRNKAWAQATPTLSLDIAVNNGELFEVGKGYTLTFSLDEDGEATA